MPNVDVLVTNVKLSKRVLLLRKNLSHICSRWKKEYLFDIHEYHRMNEHVSNTVERGEVALVHEAGAMRLAWEMGVITDLITGKDGEVRGVTIQVICKGKPLILGRPNQKAYPLKISNTVRDFRISENVEMKNGQIGINKNGVVDMEEKNCREEVRGGNPRPSPQLQRKPVAKANSCLIPGIKEGVC